MAGLEVRNDNGNNMELKESKLEVFSNEQNMHKDDDLMMLEGSGIKIQISQKGTKIEVNRSHYFMIMYLIKQWQMQNN